MEQIARAKAERILAGAGWLSRQPVSFQREVLRRGILQNFAPGEAAFHFGDQPGGIYGLVSGTVAVNTSPPTASPRLIHLGAPGYWTGEGAFLTRQPRRVELRAVTAAKMMHLPLSAMDQLEADDPLAVRYFAQIIMMNVDVLIRIVHDLQQPEAARRIASVLNRAASVESPLTLTQVDLGAMANASRKQVNAALQRFAKQGWVSNTYRSIQIVDPKGLARFGRGDDI